MFPTAVCIFRSGERTYRSGECTFRNAERRIKACYDKITIAIVRTLPQLLSDIHYNYPHTITILILSRVRAYARSINFQFLLSLLSLVGLNATLSDV